MHSRRPTIATHSFSIGSGGEGTKEARHLSNDLTGAQIA
jgi:hypothetical protein